MIIVLGDQLALADVLPDDYRIGIDYLWMAESHAEARRVWSHKARVALFFSAMRHFRDEARAAGHTVVYRQTPNQTLAELLLGDIHSQHPKSVHWIRPGDWQVMQSLQQVLTESGTPHDFREDPHFYTTPDDFRTWADGRRDLRMEYFYRAQRRCFDLLIEDGKPCGGSWNYDASNRESFGTAGPGWIQPPQVFGPDATTREVIAEVEDTFGDHPGSLENFDWPVNRTQALEALTDFITHRLPLFGHYQDAIWCGEPWLYHSRLSAAMNLHLLNPREVVTASIDALHAGHAPLNAVEGFVRQILGWREFIRGHYWLRMPEMLEDNALEATEPLPEFFWNGETDMACLRDALSMTLRYGYAHHIQRLMVTGLFCLLLGVRPQQVHAWYHAIYVDAVEWVELPNTIGMSQFADGGKLASKPYIASGAYIQRMSNACAQCRYKPNIRHGENACPYTVLYWDFLQRHAARLANHPRLRMQWRNLERLDEAEKQSIRQQAAKLRESYRFSSSATGA